MKLYKRIPIAVDINHCWSTDWDGLKWVISVIYEKRFLWWSWKDYEGGMYGPFVNRAEAKALAKRLRKKYKLNNLKV